MGALLDLDDELYFCYSIRWDFFGVRTRLVSYIPVCPTLDYHKADY